MGLYGVLHAGVSGMNAQSNRLGTVADNIQNQNTTGYKRASTEFSSLLIDPSPGSYDAGSVDTVVRHRISEEGTGTATNSPTDLTIKGNGFFVVKDGSGRSYLTRAGNFVVDGQTGDLVNAAGMRLQGYSLANGEPSVSLNSFDGMMNVNVAKLAMKTSPSTAGTLEGNLFSDTPIATNPPGYSLKSSITTYDNLGHPFKADLYFAKTANNTWQVTAYDASLPGNYPGTPLGGPTTLTFNAFGQIAGAPKLNFTVPNGQPFTLDLSPLSQVADVAQVSDIKARSVNGNAASAVEGADIDTDGTVYAIYRDGSRRAAFRIPVASVGSPDNLTPRAGNVFDVNPESGPAQIGFANVGGRGHIQSKMLENSTVDLGTELATMIEAQTTYGANSKVFQTGSEMLELLVNLKR
ncbi:flagellar hook protein FlgE [Methylobacterium sp. 22177]|uniref:flagellar hook protein FlgE n=1 Tax=Methylobacterium sp. 22177 TaxID=3453885 RepID=UPI0004668FE9